MLKNSFNSNIPQEEKEENKSYVEFHVFNFTNKIRRLTSRLELQKKKISYLKGVGIRRILGKRQRLPAYFSKKNRVCYNKLIDQLDIQEPKIR